MKIFSYTLPYSGSRFINNIFRTGYGFDFIGDYHLQQRGRPNKSIHLDQLDCPPITRKWWNTTISPYYYGANTNILFHAHNFYINSKILSSLFKNKPEIPVITSIRDPLSIINTSIWTTYALTGRYIFNQTKAERKQRVEDIAMRLISILSIPRQNIYIFPIELGDKIKQKINNFTIDFKLRKINNIFTKPIGETTKTKALYTREHGKEFDYIKHAINIKDISLIKEYLKIELDCLSVFHNLRSKLINLGYHPIW